MSSLRPLCSFYFAGSQPGGHDRPERTCGSLPLRRPRQPPDWPEELGDAPQGLKFPLPRAQTCRHCGIHRVHQKRMEDIAKLAKDIRLECKYQSFNERTTIFHIQGSPLSRADLRAVNVNLCDMCIILSAKVKICLSCLHPEDVMLGFEHMLIHPFPW